MFDPQRSQFLFFSSRRKRISFMKLRNAEATERTRINHTIFLISFRALFPSSAASLCPCSSGDRSPNAALYSAHVGMADRGSTQQGFAYAGP